MEEFFESAAAFRDWLAENHRSAAYLWVGFHKKATGRPTLTWPEAVDEALCYGWIDGLRKGMDGERYRIRFTPRRRDSTWSAVNLKRVPELVADGRMQPEGLAVYAGRRADKAEQYSYERQQAALDEESLAHFQSHPEAWEFWCAQPPGYRKQATWWVISAKKAETRQRRLDTLIEDSRQGRLIKALAR
ncbi:MAG: YdeI/OmpD-associated family protein [Candidatus Eremiobacteraeota bacterium]|nr:YdeI/OmpD-associated family protein [Candidatus Eremiobacteraeota bacterium]MCW5868122.1 YdeI/OmpD-associated family protein [Candidatus Eremiobacteraeota bacterium]